MLRADFVARANRALRPSDEKSLVYRKIIPAFYPSPVCLAFAPGRKPSFRVS